MLDLILRGPPCTSPKIDGGVGEYFFQQAEKLGEKIFQVDGMSGKHESYQEVKRRSTRVAIYLRKLGIKEEDIVLLCCKNNLDNIVPALASLFLGAIVSSVDPKQNASDVEHAVTLVEPKVIIVEEGSIDLIERSLQDMEHKPFIIVIGNSSKMYPNMLDIEKNSKGESEFQPVKQKGSDIGTILFSSGTTSLPKGIKVSHFSLLNSAACLLQHNYLKPGGIMHFTSLYWITAWALSTLCIVTGTTKVVSTEASGELFLKIVEKFKVTYLFCPSTFTYQLTDLPKSIIGKYDTSSLLTISIGGSTIDPKQILRVKEYLPHTFVNLAFGITEAFSVSGHDFTNPKACTDKPSSSGTLFPEVQMKIVDATTGKLLGPSQQGEIRVRSSFIMSGYHKASNPDIFDEDGFLKLGDVGYYDEDGHIYVTDRISEMFKYQNNHVSPTIIENVMLQHPVVAETVAFGVPHSVDQNHPAACVVLKAGVNATPEDLIEFVNSKVSDYYQLRGGVMILETIPRTPTGKLQRRMVRDSFIKMKKERD